VPARVPLHAFRRPGGARGVEDIAGLAGFDPLDRDLLEVGSAQPSIVQSTASGPGGGLDVPPANQDVLGREPGELDRLVHEGFVPDDVSAAHARVRGDHHPWPGIVYAGRQVRCGEPTENYGVDRTLPQEARTAKIASAIMGM
jgi:hypothetical protein